MNPQSTDNQKETILIADDDELIRVALKHTLKKQGYDVVLASDGDEAIQIIENQPVAVIICDQNMPGAKGVQVLSRALELQPQAARIAITGVSDFATITEFVNQARISHFILKPWDNEMLLNVIKSSLNQVRLINENSRLTETIKANHESLQEEIKLGGVVQKTMLIGQVPEDIPGLKIGAITIPSKQIDGDFYDFYRTSADTLDIVIADVMGKGLPAALVGTAVKTQLSRFAIPFKTTKSYSKNQGWQDEILPPTQVMEHVQKHVSESLIDLEHFVCLMYGRFMLNKKVFTFVDCGSTKPIHYSAKKKKATVIQGDNFPLGLVKGDTFNHFTVSYDKDDLFIFYSDGVTEAKREDQEQFGMDNFLSLVESNGDKDPDSLIQIILKELQIHTGKESYDDDLTLVIVKSTSKAPVIKEEMTNSAKFASDLSQLTAVRYFIERLCIDAPGDPTRLRETMELAVNEAFCNIVEHGYEENPKGEIRIEGELTLDGICVTIADRGKPFQPAMIHDPSFAGDRFGGFGLFMIKEIADELSYTPRTTDEGWNEMIIFKKYLHDEVHMNITHEKRNNVLTIKLEGPSLDAKEAPQFKRETLSLIDGNNLNFVVLNLENLNFIDSSGLGTFLSILRQLNSRGGDLKISGMNKSIRTVFELVCMHKIFEIYNNVDDALLSFERNAPVKG